MPPHARFRKMFEVRPSPVQGRGAFATRRIPPGTRIIEYTGERITHEEADARYDDRSTPRHHTFLFTVDDQFVVDAAVDGNDARFVNHSCEPNCTIKIEKQRIFIDALRDIAPGAELFYDYAFRREEGDDAGAERLYACRCGSRRCRGTILSPRR